MCKRYSLKFVILVILLNTYCVSIPKIPKNNTDECLTFFLHSKREMKAIQQENRQTNGIIGVITFGLIFGFGYPGFLTLLAIPYFQIENQNKIDIIERNLNEKHCSN
jgi:hypothetical protein